VESYVERSQRLLDNGQYELAINPLLEGLAKVPDNVSLLLRKALVQLHLNQNEPAAETLRLLLQKHPGHLGGSILMTRLALDTEGVQAGVAQFQQSISAQDAGERSKLASLASFLGSALARAQYPAAAIKHLELAARLSGEESKRVASHLQNIRANPAFSVWEKNPYRLWPAPEHATEAFRESFQRALGWAEEGLWSTAASAFELLGTGTGVGVVADRNRGLCCLWLADHDAAVAALRRYINRTKPTTDSVDLEALCQRIEPPSRHDLVEFDRLSWPIRNRDGLLAALRADRTIAEGDSRPLDPRDEDSEAFECFLLLDRPAPEAKPGLSRLEIPVVEAEVLVDKDVVYLEALDDGRLDRLVDRFTSALGTTIPPAHPRTKVIAAEPRHELALLVRWYNPPGISDEETERLRREHVGYITNDVWPTTPHPSLRRRTPLQAGLAGESEAFLRASIRRMESSHDRPDSLLDWDALRAKLHVKPEPPIDAESVDIDQLHLSRLAAVPIERLDDDRLVAIYRQAVKWGQRRVKNQAARLIDQRPTLMTTGRIEMIDLYGDLAVEAAHDGDRAKAEEWLVRGRQSESPKKRSANALAWEMIGLEVKMLLDEPEVWVPVLAVILERCRGNNEATSAVLLRLVSLGLVQAGVDPKRPEQVILDTEMLELYLKRYGPRVTTAAGELGVAASRSEIWTPESAEAPSAIWTPGSSPARSEEKSKLILPGQ
jgi:tetratricopeptide (TPR) repeat protein